MVLSGIYKIQSICMPERIYIGSAVHFARRKQRHLRYLRQNKHHSIKLQRHFNFYGESDLKFSIIHSCSKEELINAEQFFLDSHKTYFNTCKIAGSLNRLSIPHSIETKSKMRLNNKSHLPEIRLKISLANKGKKRTEITKQKMREKIVTEETRKRMSQAQKGLKKKPHDQRFKEAMRLRCRYLMKPILQYDLQMNLIREWDSANIAQEFISPGTRNNGVRRCAKERRKTYKGFIWKYKTNNHETNSTKVA